MGYHYSTKSLDISHKINFCGNGLSASHSSVDLVGICVRLVFLEVTWINEVNNSALGGTIMLYSNVQFSS